MSPKTPVPAAAPTGAMERAQRMVYLDQLARLIISSDVTTRATLASDGRPIYLITRPCGAGTEVIARGDYDRCLLQLTRRRDAHGPA